MFTTMKKISTLPVLEKVSLVLAIALIACLLPLPYGFYTLIRFATAIVAVCWAYTFYKRRQTALAIFAAAVALLFQPFVKIVMDRSTWNVVDLILAVLILIAVFKRK